MRHSPLAVLSAALYPPMAGAARRAATDSAHAVRQFRLGPRCWTGGDDASGLPGAAG